MPAADLGSSASRARAEQEKESETVIETTFAYLVYQRKDTGQYVLTNDINQPVVMDRNPTLDEVYGSMSVVQKDLAGQQYAGMAAQANLQMNNFLAQQMAGQQDLDRVVKAGGGLRG